MKLIPMIIVRLIEIAIVALGSWWLWSNFDPAYRVWVVAAVVVAYLAYLGVTLFNDIEDWKFGESEPRM